MVFGRGIGVPVWRRSVSLLLRLVLRLGFRGRILRNIGMWHTRSSHCISANQSPTPRIIMLTVVLVVVLNLVTVTVLVTLLSVTNTTVVGASKTVTVLPA